MKMKPAIALFAASALLAGVAGAQEKAAEAPAADQPLSLIHIWITGKAARGSAPKRRIRKILFMGDGRNCIHT